MPVVKFEIPVATPNPSNGSIGMSRGAAMGKASKNKKQRNTAEQATLVALGRTLPRWRVKLIRVSSGFLDGHDNLRSALKRVADGVALGLGGVNDGGGLIEWDYDQVKGKPGQQTVFAEIEILP
jgi:hypothetical protein